MPKLEGQSGGTDDFDNNDEDEQDFKGYNEDGIDVAMLESEVPNRDYAEYIIESVKCEVKCEDALVRKIVYTVLSKDSNDPLNLGILAPTSEGKTYPVINTIKNWDSKDIWLIASMSPRYLIRQYGITVDETGVPIEEREGQLLRAIKRAKADRDATLRFRIKEKQKKLAKDEKEGKKEPKFDSQGRRVIEIEEADEDDTLEILEKELDELYEKSKTVIDLEGKLLVFLEPPHPDTWNIIKPILSHDTYFMEHPYVDKVGGRIRGIRIVTKGWPAVIMCSAKNEAEQQYWSEIQSRFDISSPNMIAEKYRQGNEIIAIKAGDPDAVQQRDIIDRHRRRVAMECGRYLANRIRRLSKDKIEEKVNLTWIPFNKILIKVLPAEKGTDNRINSRVFNYLKMITISRSHLRNRMVFGNENLIIVDIKEDLHEALHISQNNIGMPTFKLERFKDVFVPMWFNIEGMEAIAQRDITQVEEQLAQDSNNALKVKAVAEAKKKSLKQVVDGQLMLIVTAHQLCDYWKAATGRPTTVQNVTKTYLTEWISAGMIDEVALDGRQKKGYYPIIDLEQYNGMSKFTPKSYSGNFTGSVVERMNNITQHASLITTGNKGQISKHWLYNRLVKMLDSHEYMIGSKTVKIFDENDKQISISDFIHQYENDDTGNLIDFFSVGEYTDNDQNVEYDESLFEAKS